MARVSVVLLGVGTVGRAFLHRLMNLPQGQCSNLSLVAVADSSGILAKSEGLPPALWPAIAAGKANGRPISDWPGAEPPSALPSLVEELHLPFIVVDLTASDDTLPLLLSAAERGAGLVLANKRPLCSSYDTWRALFSTGRMRYEATVGAGLPVIRLLQYLLSASEDVHLVQAALSGSLGYLFSRLDEEVPLSAAIRQACQAGYTEPDPRDDLGGMDVARKALILARTLGLRLELKDIAVESLYPPHMARLSVPEFLATLEELDQFMEARMARARGNGCTLRYLATIKRQEVTIGLQEIPLSSPFAALSGPDNLVIVESTSFPSPIRLAGPGAGPEVTATAVLADLWDLSHQMACLG